MSDTLPNVFLARHGETDWSISGQHTGLTDLPLTARGEQNARSLGRMIGHQPCRRVLVSPLLRARRTCELAGFGERAETDVDLVEWNYGDYEGLTTKEIRTQRPGWNLFQDGCPGGESPAQVGERADRVIARLRSTAELAIVFSSGDFLRVLAARWIGLESAAGRLLKLSTASLSVLGYDHTLAEPVIKSWNDDRHVAHWQYHRQAGVSG